MTTWGWEGVVRNVSFGFGLSGERVGRGTYCLDEGGDDLAVHDC